MAVARLFKSHVVATSALDAGVLLGEWREGIHEEAAERGIVLPAGHGPDLMLGLKARKGFGQFHCDYVPRLMIAEIRRRSGLSIEELNAKLGLSAEQRCFYKMPYGTCKAWHKKDSGWARMEQYGMGPVMDREGASKKIWWEDVAEYAGRVLGGEWVVERPPGCYAAIRRVG